MERGAVPALERFIAWFESLRISQAELAERLGCDQSAVSRILRGERGVGLAIGLAIERETKGWKHGRILAKEWSHNSSTGANDNCQGSGARRVAG